MKAFHARSLGQPVHDQPERIVGHRVAVKGQEEVADPMMNWFRPKVIEVLQERLLRRTSEWQ